MSPMPGVRHGIAETRIASLIFIYLLQNPIGQVTTNTGVVVETDPDTVRGPDVMFYSHARLPAGLEVVGYHDAAPDLAVEVLSLSNRPGEIAAKRREYFAAGVRLLWIADPARRVVSVEAAGTPAVELAGSDALGGGEVLPGFTCRVADLFA